MTTETYKKLELNAEQLATLTHLKQYFVMAQLMNPAIF